MAEASVTNQLPPEVLVKIFEHCDLKELVNIVDVCQLWRDLAIHQYNTSGNDLVIRRPDDINDLISFLCKPVSFNKLHIVWDVPSDVDCSSMSLDALTDATSLDHLQSFTLKVNREEEDEEKNECHEVLAALLTLILQTSTDTLTHFTLINTILIHPVELIEACQHLSHLVLNGCKLFDEWQEKRLVIIIPKLTHLQLLDLRGTLALRLFYLSFVADVKRGCPNISNNIMINKLEVRPSDDLSMLQFVSHVDRLFIEEFDTAQLRSLISCLNDYASQLSVDKLHVQSCKNHVTDNLLLSLVQRLRGLKEVHADGCQHLTNQGVVNVITSSPDLEGIDIQDIENIDTGIMQLLDRVVTKQKVRIDACFTTLSNSNEMFYDPDCEVLTDFDRYLCLKYFTIVLYRW